MTTPDAHRPPCAVHLLGSELPLTILGDSLNRPPQPGDAPWRLVSAADLAEGSAPDIVICAADEAAAATARWVAATVVAVVSSVDDGPAVVGALEAGAHVCVRGTEPELIRAYVASIARRRAEAQVHGAAR